jgi:quercetin dioxygenase-like cupin family protein
MIILPGDRSPASERRSTTFTGVVWATPLISDTDGVAIASIFFAPGGRTFWHSHERGQILHVTAGSGLVCTQGEQPRSLRIGDSVWIPPGEIHWHGAGARTWMSHLAASLGTTTWADSVSDTDYAAGGASS